MQTLAPTHSRLRRTAAALLGIGMVGSVVAMGAAPANADSVATVPTVVLPTQNAPEAMAERAIPPVELELVVIRSKGAAEIAKRQGSLTSTQAKLASQKADCGFNAARAGEMTATSVGLTALGNQLAATTDLPTAQTLYRKIYTDFRVYLVVLPKAGKAMRCDNALESIAKFNESALKVQAEIDAAKAKGADTTAAQALKDAAVASVTVPNPAAAITPCMGLLPDMGNTTVQAANAAALQSCDASLDSVFASLKSARAKLEQARAALKSARATDRESDKAADKAKREAAKDLREAQRDADKSAREAAKDLREAQRDADKAKREAAKDLREAQRDAAKAAREAAKLVRKS